MQRADEHGTAVEIARWQAGWLAPAEASARRATGTIPAGARCGVCADMLRGDRECNHKTCGIRCGRAPAGALRVRWSTCAPSWCPHYTPATPETPHE